MIPMRKWSWQTWAIVGMFPAIMAGWVPGIVHVAQERAEVRAAIALPKTSDLFRVTYVQLDRDAHGHLVVYTDAHALVTFEGRFKVSLRDRTERRHVWTPQWSEWIEYAANPGGTRYRQPETLQWWADYPHLVEPPPGSWVMETCWQARVEDPTLGLVELEPVCLTSLLDLPAQPINNEVKP